MLSKDSNHNFIQIITFLFRNFLKTHIPIKLISQFKLKYKIDVSVIIIHFTNILNYYL